MRVGAAAGRADDERVYVGEIEGLDGRIQKALDIQTVKLLRQVDFMVEAAARRAGL